ncbi:hypothetical protein A3A93_01975 [Candidatus Roizmanbacteria bacterium RIFCSPLOWO2_01_FULL_38_12]|uniref:Antitoxin n=1 Tax=Candidatus Roizmanbacteria bacterium RIFCSPLOWO2_01_FULL_38_12 TaxID=1802061 RepID=A0A1F7IXW8_9BACT|nr:MAG: hypothetical protein A2861_01495 [Candidatus Roizmanbacteria bacterium RIFCSPHIGHO2_01_FULL_38_15]OGK35294.1 MAG: hypothetical protein A3F59_02900 [Candidatus Roizmanbacteria bacterium RIFCSPHIGHO2_12_FULL_38_13]OGK48220.1 MAG: hypothetical protein A3A93_01975 [Candidatus Roizmanbacteria bacterium RIFCSPLOWO2_01_FULL_38_12]
MNAITIQDLKTRGSKAIPTETTFLIVHSKVKSAIVPIDEYNMLLDALEELEDIRDIEARKDEKSIPFEEVFK